MLIRRESTRDIDAIRRATAEAFARPGQEIAVEAPLVNELRASDAWLPAPSLVATGADGGVIGHVVCSRGKVETTPVLGLGPLSVSPEHQRAGVGSALVHAALGGADALGEPLVALLGDPAYYSRFGFRLSDGYGITPPQPEWQRHFQVRTLAAYTPATTGQFTYAEPFDHV